MATLPCTISQAFDAGYRIDERSPKTRGSLRAGTLHLRNGSRPALIITYRSRGKGKGWCCSRPLPEASILSEEMAAGLKRANKTAHRLMLQGKYKQAADVAYRALSKIPKAARRSARRSADVKVLEPLADARRYPREFGRAWEELLDRKIREAAAQKPKAVA